MFLLFSFIHSEEYFQQDVTYDIELSCITSVKHLEIKDGKIGFHSGEAKKVKKTTKTKSNIDRLLTTKKY